MYSENPSTMASMADGLASYGQFRIISLHYSNPGSPSDSDFFVIDLTNSPAFDPAFLLPDPDYRSPPQVLCVADSHRDFDDLLTRPTGISFSGFIDRSLVEQTIGPALTAMACGLEVYPVGYRQRPHDSLEREGREWSAGILSDREITVLRNVARGLPSKAIAAELGVSERTVKFHINSIFAKLGVHTRTEAAMEGARQGLIPI